MTIVTADQLLLERLAGIMEPVEIRDADGKLMGTYRPVVSDENEVHERAARYFDLAEAERTLAEKSQGSSHEEVWKRIRARESRG